MVGPVDLPPEVLLKLLSLLNVADVLRAEKSCVLFRDVVSTRHFWLSKLNGLDQVRAPNLPRCVGPLALSYSELRDIVVKAECTYNLLMKSLSLMQRVEYRLVKTLPLDNTGVVGFVRGPQHRVPLVRIVPGGRYLFLLHLSHSGIQFIRAELQLVDLKNGNKLIWSLDFVAVANSLGGAPLNHELGVEMYADLSMAVAFAMGSGVSFNNHFYACRLQLPSVPDASPQITQKVEVTYGQLCRVHNSVAVSRDFVIFGLIESTVVVMDLNSCQSKRLQLPRELLRNVQMWEDRLFCIVRSGDRDVLCTFSITEAMATSVLDPVVLLDDSTISYFEPPFPYFEYSLFDRHWKHNQQAITVSFISVSYSGCLPPMNIESARATFHRDREGSAKWSLIDSRVSECPWKVPFPFLHGAHFKWSQMSRLSHSCRGIVSIYSEGEGLKEFALISMEESGGVVVHRFPSNIAKYAALSDHHLLPYIEPHSGMVVYMKRKWYQDVCAEIYALAGPEYVHLMLSSS